jgi:hypothetical protein
LGGHQPSNSLLCLGGIYLKPDGLLPTAWKYGYTKKEKPNDSHTRSPEKVFGIKYKGNPIGDYFRNQQLISQERIS